MHMTSGSSYTGHNLVFIVGCPRSGTTWVQRLLACHPKIRTGQESHIFNIHIGPQLRHWRQLSNPEFRGGIGLGCYFTEEEFVKILKSFLMTLLQPLVGSLQAGEIFVEKTPTHALFIAEILDLLPQSRFIHVLRDPRDVVASLISASHSWGSKWAPHQSRDAVRTWMKHVTSVHEARRKSPSWQFHEIRYEDLHTSPKNVLKGLTDFLALKWSDEEMSRAIEANRPAVAMATGGGTAIPLGGEAAKRSGPVVIEPQGFIRKAKVASWRTDLTTRDKFRIWRMARKLMADVGYQGRLFFLPFVH